MNKKYSQFNARKCSFSPCFHYKKRKFVYFSLLKDKKTGRQNLSTCFFKQNLKIPYPLTAAQSVPGKRVGHNRGAARLNGQSRPPLPPPRRCRSPHPPVSPPDTASAARTKGRAPHPVFAAASRKSPVQSLPCPDGIRPGCIQSDSAAAPPASPPAAAPAESTP